MAPKARYLLLAMMDVEPDKEAVFNDLYDNEHIPAFLKVPGVLSAARYETTTEPLPEFMRMVGAEGLPKYAAVYELESPDVPASEAFKQAAEIGDWPQKVRPYCKNRAYLIFKLIQPGG